MLEQLRAAARRVVPARLWWAARRLVRPGRVPPPGLVRFGDLRRTTPIAADFGYQRGGPVDRGYIESFLAEHVADVRGRALEVGDDAYVRRFGAGRVTHVDVLHVDGDVPGTTIVGDLADENSLPPDTFDCIVLTQTLHFVYDFEAALRTVGRALAPGGVLLLTVPGITNVDPGEWGDRWNYSFSQHAVRRMCANCFDGFAVETQSYGNVLAAIAFLHGLGHDELSPAERDDLHVEYALIHAVRVVKPAVAAH